MVRIIPDEIYIYILSYLPVGKIMKFKLLSKQFNKIVTSEMMYKKMIFRGDIFLFNDAYIILTNGFTTYTALINYSDNLEPVAKIWTTDDLNINWHNSGCKYLTHGCKHGYFKMHLNAIYYGHFLFGD